MRYRKTAELEIEVKVEQKSFQFDVQRAPTDPNVRRIQTTYDPVHLKQQSFASFSSVPAVS